MVLPPLACAKVAHDTPFPSRNVLETWNDISTHFATYELELDRITRLVPKIALREGSRRLVRRLMTVAHFLWPIHIRLIHMTAETRLSMVKDYAALLVPQLVTWRLQRTLVATAEGAA